MPRVHTQKAAKDYPAHGIKKGDTYYSWTFRHGGKRMSKTYPRASQLTQSKMSGAYAASETASDTIGNAGSISDIAEALRDAASEIRDVAQEYRDAKDAMPENFQYGSVAEECENKADELESWADTLESDADEVEALDACEFIDDSIAVEDLPEDLTEEEDCDNCDGKGKLVSDEQTIECTACEGTGKAARARKDVSDFDDLTSDEQDAMLNAARDIANNNIDCPL